MVGMSIDADGESVIIANDLSVQPTVPISGARNGARTGGKHSQHASLDAKDEGYAWIVVLVMFVSNVVLAGYVKSFGMISNAILEAYPGTSAASVGVIMALLAGCRSLPAPAVGAAAVQFGYRPVMMCGALLCSTALLSAFFSTSVASLAVTLGAMMGIGMCTVETCQVVVMSDYFSEKKALANSIRVAGNPLGGAALPFLLVLLFEYYGLKLTYIILSALFLQLFFLSFLIRPYMTHVNILQSRRLNRLRKAEESTIDQEEKIPSLSLNDRQNEEKNKKFDIKLFSNPIYLTHIVMMVCVAAALPQTMYFVPIFGKSINLSPQKNSIILSYIAVYDSVTRLIIGCLLNRRLLKSTHCFSACLVIGGVGTCLVPLSRGFWGLIATLSIASIACSGFYANIHVILTDQFGNNNTASSWGFIRMVQGLLNFVYPPVLGLLVDQTEQFWMTFLWMGIAVGCGGIIIALQPCIARATKINMNFM